MYYFIDTADTEKIRHYINAFPVDGVTTNPIIIARENRAYRELLLEIRGIIGDRLLFVQVVSKDSESMIREAECVNEKICGNLCIKIPMNAEGLKAILALSHENISTAATAVYTPMQALLAAKAGADFVAPYISHIDNMALDGTEVAGQMAGLFKENQLKTKVLAASFRTAEQINRVILNGAQAVTVAPEMFDTMLKSTGTSAELENFESAWEKVYPGRTILDLL